MKKSIIIMTFLCLCINCFAQVPEDPIDLAQWYGRALEKYLEATENVKAEKHEEAEQAFKDCSLLLAGYMDNFKQNAGDLNVYQVDAFKRVSELHRDVFMAQGVYMASLKKYEKAIVFFEKSIEADSQNFKAFLAIGNLYYIQGKKGTLEKWAKKIDRQFVLEDDMRYLIAKWLVFCGKKEEAANILEAIADTGYDINSIKNDPDFEIFSKYYRGQNILTMSNENAEELEKQRTLVLEKATTIEPVDIDKYAVLITYLFSKNKRKEAEEWIGKTEEIVLSKKDSPYRDKYYNSSNFYFLAASFSQLENADKTLEYINMAIELFKEKEVDANQEISMSLLDPRFEFMKKNEKYQELISSIIDLDNVNYLSTMVKDMLFEYSAMLAIKGEKEKTLDILSRLNRRRYKILRSVYDKRFVSLWENEKFREIVKDCAEYHKAGKIMFMSPKDIETP